MSGFQGFEIPEANWSKVPNAFWNIEGLNTYEQVLLLYTLRHTWGFHEYGCKPKVITVDEYMNGRRRKDGTRLDKGTGISRGSVSRNLNSLEKKGFLLVETDDRDKARIKKGYSVRMAGSTPDEEPDDEPDDQPDNGEDQSSPGERRVPEGNAEFQRGTQSSRVVRDQRKKLLKETF